MSRQTIKFMLSLPIDRAHISLLTLYPGTTLFYEILGKDTSKQLNWNSIGAYYAFSDGKPIYLSENRKLYEIKRKYFYGLIRFYFRPKQILMIIRALNKDNFTEITRYIKSILISLLKTFYKKTRSTSFFL